MYRPALLVERAGLPANLVLIILSAALALGAAVNAGGAHVPPLSTAWGSVTAPIPNPTPTPAPPHYDVMGGGGPT